jgi:hypothetical protein
MRNSVQGRSVRKLERTWIYRPGGNDEDAELRFELDFLASLTVAQRYRRMFRQSRVVREIMISHGHLKTTGFTQRA